MGNEQDNNQIDSYVNDDFFHQEPNYNNSDMAGDAENDFQSQVLGDSIGNAGEEHLVNDEPLITTESKEETAQDLNGEQLERLQHNEASPHEGCKGCNKPSEELIQAFEGKKVFKIKIINSSSIEYCILKKNLMIKKDDFVIVPTRYGKDLGKIEGKVHNLKEIGVNEVYTIERLATKDDLKLFAKNKQKNDEAFKICKEKIAKHNLEMKLVSAHYLLGEQKILFFFTAESRVDFRELVKDLVSVFKTRIELRQIGVRDEARVLGGIGVCGREYCCHNLRDKLDTVSIKMAKKQNLSLNSLKISGPCGRLLCCLAYEYCHYNEARSKIPDEGTEITFENETFKIQEVNVVAEKIRASSASGRVLAIDFDRFVYNADEKKWLVKE